MVLGAGLEPAAALALPAPAPMTRLPITVSGETRDAWIEVPVAAPAGGRYPLVFGFHGGGGAARGYIDDSRLLAKAQAAGFIAICPEGTVLPLPGDHRHLELRTGICARQRRRRRCSSHPIADREGG